MTSVNTTRQSDSRTRSKIFRRIGTRPEDLSWRTLLTMIFLLVLGIGFTISGLFVWWEWGLYEAIPFWTIGGIGIIPGLYACIIIVRTYLGHRGFRYDQIPRP
eukprot:UN20127